MEIIDNESSDFHDVVLEKCKVLEVEDATVGEPIQSPHIDERLRPNEVDTSTEDVNKCSNSAGDKPNQKDLPPATDSTGNVATESQVTSASDENMNSLGIPETPSSADSADNNSQIKNVPSLQNTSCVSIMAKDEGAVITAVAGKEGESLGGKGSEASLPGHSVFNTNDLDSTEIEKGNSSQAAILLLKTPEAQSNAPCDDNKVTGFSPTHVVPKDVPSLKSEEHTPSPVHSEVVQSSPSHLLPKTAASPKNQPSLPTPPPTPPEETEKHQQLLEQLRNYECQVEQLKKALSQKENTITLYQRENALLEKEKTAFRKEKELATKEKESIVIKFATKEKSLIDAKKQKDSIEKQLADSRKEVKNISTKFYALNEEKSRITYMLDEKCNEVKRFQKELEKQKTEYSNLEMKLKWNSVKLAQETEAKLAAERKLEEERNAPKPLEEKANEKLKMEYEATAILLKHEIENKDKTIDALTKDNKQTTEKLHQLQETMSKEILENTSLSRELECLKQEHVVVQNSYSEEMLNSAKLRGQLEELQVLRTQHTINEDKINTLNENLRELEDKVQDSTQDLEQLQTKEQELLSINKEMSEMIVGLQNEICLQTSKVKGIEAENDILKKEKSDFDTKYNEIESQLKQEIQQKSDERILLTKHLSEKTKLYESVKAKLDNVQGDLEAIKKKHSQVVKELHRELQKYKKFFDEKTSPSSPTSKAFCRNCELKSTSQERIASTNSRGSNNSRSDSESEAQSTTSTMNRDVQGPSKQHLVERILRLQQASARQTEKIDFLENHTLSLVAELQKKSKVVQYYMMRDQAGALTSSKSDQNKSELAKYGGVMSAIYSGIKGPNQSMTLELSLEINKKLQAVLEDTLLKNITLKENLDVLGLEVDKLTRKLAQQKS